ncbi:hypothetical protein BX600DRAFT_460686 [Xylariales sp. PMI_506]|nr:hypothetical protein BX600DRAFT_460686 [Xylariales sp. PMI_506]
MIWITSSGSPLKLNRQSGTTSGMVRETIVRFLPHVAWLFFLVTSSHAVSLFDNLIVNNKESLQSRHRLSGNPP